MDDDSSADKYRHSVLRIAVNDRKRQRPLERARGD